MCCKLFWKRHYALIKRGLLSAVEFGLSRAVRVTGVPPSSRLPPFQHFPAPSLGLLFSASGAKKTWQCISQVWFIAVHLLSWECNGKTKLNFTRARARGCRVQRVSANLPCWELPGVSSTQDSLSQRRKDLWGLCWRDWKACQETSELTPSTSFNKVTSFKSPWGWMWGRCHWSTVAGTVLTRYLCPPLNFPDSLV